MKPGRPRSSRKQHVQEDPEGVQNGTTGLFITAELPVRINEVREQGDKNGSF